MILSRFYAYNFFMGLDFFESRIIFIPISQPKMKIENPKIVMMSRKIEITCPGVRIIVSIPLACAISLPLRKFVIEEWLAVSSS